MPWKSVVCCLALLAGFVETKTNAQTPATFPVFPNAKPPEPIPVASFPNATPSGNGNPATNPPIPDFDTLPPTNPLSGPAPLPSPVNPEALATTVQAFGEEVRMGVDFDFTLVPKTPYINWEGEYLLLAPRGNPTAVAETRPNGPGQYSDTIFIPGGFESGFRVGVSVVDPIRDVDLTLRYTYFSWQSDIWSYSEVSPSPNFYPYYPNPAARSGSNSSSMVAMPSGGLNPLLMAPNYLGPVAQVSAKSTIVFQFGDLEFAKIFRPDERIDFRLFAGPRYAYLSQSLQTQYTGGSINQADYGSQVMFNGAGMRVGGDAQARFLGNFGIRLWGSASVLAGAYQGRVDQSINGSSVASMRETTLGTVPILDGGIGISFGDQKCSMLIGYEFQSWINVLQGYTGNYDNYQPRMQRQYGNLGFDGFSGLGVQVTMSW